MSTPKLVGSVLMLGFRGDSLDHKETRDEIDELKAVKARGVILFDHDLKSKGKRNIRSPKQLTKLIADLRNELGEGLIVAIDQEGGQVARLNEDNGFLATISAEEFGGYAQIDQVQYATNQANQLSKLGIDLNFAPCVDLAVDECSPIIAGKERSFGLRSGDVARCAQIVVDAHRKAGVGCCIKHFPGHGSAVLDSHLGVCEITKTHTEDETKVFADLITRNGHSIAVMSGHLLHKGIDNKLPASLSAKHTTELLRKQLGFDGMVVTDSLDMRAIRDRFGEGHSAAMALNAGADLTLDGLNAKGYRQEGAPAIIARAIGESVSNEKLEEASARIDRFMSRLRP